MSEKTLQRQVAYRIFLGDLVSGRYVKSLGEWEPNYVEVRAMQISRVNIIGVVVDAFSSEGSRSFVLDDGSGSVVVRSFEGGVLDVKVGECVLVVGKVRDFNGRIYVLPEIVRSVSSSWFMLRKMELKKIYKDVQKTVVEKPIVENLIVEEVVADEPSFEGREKILSIIEVKGEADVLSLIGESLLPVGEAKQIIDELLKEGEIFECSPGKIRMIS